MFYRPIRMTDIMNNPEHSREDFSVSDTGEQGVSFQVGNQSFHWSFHHQLRNTQQIQKITISLCDFSAIFHFFQSHTIYLCDKYTEM